MSMKQAASRVCSKKPPAASRRLRDAAYVKCHGARKSSWHFCLGQGGTASGSRCGHPAACGSARFLCDARVRRMFLPHVPRGRRVFLLYAPRGFAGRFCRMFPGGGLRKAPCRMFLETAERSCLMPPGEGRGKALPHAPPGVRRMFLPRAPGVEGCPCCILRGSARRRARRVESCVQTHSQRLGFRGFPPRGWLRARGLCRRTAPVLEKSAPSGRKIAVMPQIGFRLVRPMLADLGERMRRIAHEAKSAHFRGDFVAYREKNGLRRVGLSETAASGTE